MKSKVDAIVFMTVLTRLLVVCVLLLILRKRVFLLASI